VSAVAIAVHAGLPDGAPDDVLLAEALRRRGVEARLAVWDDPAVDWGATPVTVIRSTWDYHLKPDRWRGWLAAVARRTRLLNPAAVVAWNGDKRYLLDLQAAGVAIVPTAVIDTGHDLIGLCRSRGWDDVVVKPAVGASAHGARRFGPAAFPEAAAHAEALGRTGAVLVQPYQPAVERDLERSLVVIDGAYSHAFTKPAFLSGAGSDDGLAVHRATATEIETALHAAALAGPVVYARVDLLPSPGGPLLMELELIEPQLGLALAPGSVDRLARAVLGERS
jgi:glutathione synthase/RimK-type ligase-like ATP-grasp enzyme